jgi:hypothetical protein
MLLKMPTLIDHVGHDGEGVMEDDEDLFFGDGPTGMDVGLIYVNTLYIWRLLFELAWPFGKLPYQLLE